MAAVLVAAPANPDLMRIAVKWGVVLGVGVVVWTLVVHALGFYTTNLAAGQVADWVAIVLPVVAVTGAVLERRRQDHGRVSLVTALASGVGAGLVSVPIAAGFLWVYHHRINPGWLTALTQYESARLTAAGAGADEVRRAVAALERGGTDAAQLTGSLVGTVLLTAVLSVLAWLVLRLARRSPRRD